MKRSLHITKFLAALAMLVVLANGCKSPEKAPTPIPGGDVNIPGGGDTLPVIDPEVDTSGFNNNGGPDDGSTIPIPPDDPDDNPIVFVDPDEGVPMGDNLDVWDNFQMDRDAFAASVVYFGFDLTTIDPSEGPKLEQVANHLASNPTHAVLVEGHCDERGTSVYNLALGERRGLSAREYLINLGVEDSRIRTISYGEDMPANTGTTEAAYAENRRAEPILLLPLE
jgi:peptidoglycan-associated lipoprotein